MIRLRNIIGEVILGSVALLITSYVFYRNVYITIIFTLLGCLYPLLNKKNREKKFKKQLTCSFRDLLNSIYSGLLSGKSFRNSLYQSTNELRNLNSKESILLYLDKLIIDLKTGNSEIDSWLKFSKHINIETCYEFVDVLEQTYATGGQITKIINRTCQILSDKIDVVLDLELMISAKKLEFKIMMISPVLLLGMLSNSSSSYMDMLYTTVLGRCIMTFVFFGMIVSYIIGTFIINIEL